jgi:hypothetical protein
MFRSFRQPSTAVHEPTFIQIPLNTLIANVHYFVSLVLSEESTCCSLLTSTLNVPGVNTVGRDLTDLFKTDLSLIFVLRTREGRQNGPTSVEVVIRARKSSD